jgi:hypothetical protein
MTVVVIRDAFYSAQTQHVAPEVYARVVKSQNVQSLSELIRDLGHMHPYQ